MGQNLAKTMNLFFGEYGTLLNRGVEAILGFKGGEKSGRGLIMVRCQI